MRVRNTPDGKVMEIVGPDERNGGERVLVTHSHMGGPLSDEAFRRVAEDLARRHQEGFWLDEIGKRHMVPNVDVVSQKGGSGDK